MTQPEGADLEAGLATAIGHLILQDATVADHLDGEDHLRVVERAARAHEITGDLLRQSVSAARSDGVSWTTLGATLGLSRQGVQQRFGRTGGDADDLPEDQGQEHRWLGPVTALDELAELRLAGKLGWRTVEVGMLRHKMVRTPTQWEHRRVVWTRSPAHFERDGWQIAVRAFPWLYLVRDTGVPALTEIAGAAT